MYKTKRLEKQLKYEKTEYERLKAKFEKCENIQ